MLHFRYFLALFVAVLVLADAALSLPATKKGAVAKGKGKQTTSTPSVPAKKGAAGADKGKQKATTLPASSSTSSAAPVSTIDPAEGGCRKQTDCNKCVTVKGAAGSICVFTSDGQCVGRSTNPGGRLARTAAECKAFNQVNAEKYNHDYHCYKIEDQQQEDNKRTAEAQAVFAKMKPHVFGTERGLGKTSGRHLASSLTKVNSKEFILTRKKDDTTGLSTFKTEGKKVKTTFDDDLGAYTPEQVEKMCVEAVKSVLRITKAKTLPKSGTKITSVSVPAESRPGVNLCISVQGNVSVFPGSIKATSAPPGQPCVPDAEVGDE
ncbi:hypothetical protein PQX77_018923 [Marasmius sp. AFHP31]|nr:hypothetical protein PQX77_018923 [Marasmius sp. AFHP31]